MLHQFVDEYIQQEIVTPLSEASRTLLLATIELPHFSVNLCDRALGIVDSRDRMESFILEFPFVSIHPGAPTSWAWVRMIRESLLRITDASNKRLPTGDEQRAVVSMLLEDGALQDAADYALIGGDPDWVAESIRPWGEHLALRSNFEPLCILIERLPDEVFALHADFAYWQAISHLGIGRHLSLSDWLPAIERPGMDSGDPLRIGRALTIMAMAAWQGGDNTEAIAGSDAALATLPSTATTARMHAASTKARALFRTGDDAGSTAAAREAEHLAMVLPMDEQWAWRTLAMDRANAYAIRGDLHSATTKYRLIISELPKSLHFLEGAYRSRLISIAIEQDQLDVARDEHAKIEHLLEVEWRLWHIWAIVARSRLLIAEGNLGAAEAWMARHIKTLRRMPGKMQLVMHLAQVWLHHGEYAMVRSWLSDLDGLPYPIVDSFGGIDHRQIQIDLDLAEGRYAAAAELAQSMTEAAEMIGRWSDFISYSVRWAWAVSLLGDPVQAIAILAPAVERGDRGGFVRGYRVPGFDTTPLLAAARQRSIGPVGEAPPVPASLSLTPREHEVLQLVARGRSNQQIAHELFISANTVRNHLVNICRRLDAASRMEAVAKARDLGLIP
jgi:ATP/maltotriose-dependent transcriptional regulator MalT